MQKFAVIGHPIKHTMSPFIHKKLFALSNRSVEYLTLDISPETLAFETSKGILSSLDGFNVTIPHKEAIIPLIDVIDPSAEKYNAVNCVLKAEGKTFGFSTDAYGFTQALKASDVKLCGKVLILGAGGAARTLAREAADSGCDITIAVRELDLEKAESLKIWITENGGKAEVTLLTQINGEFDLCVNATPVGMYPNTDCVPITAEQLSHCKALFDAVYNPEETLLIKTAKQLGIKTVGGMAMLVWQAVKAHELWYGGTFKQSDIVELIKSANREMEKIFYEK